ncbi:MAG: hypothetical protein CL785_00085 [Chloroflexi bacterium]|nr:hypothetical protein [Chloroflexota bacterium]
MIMVAIGGSLGAVSRYAIDRLISNFNESSVLGIFFINVLGSFLLGILIGYWQIDRQYAESSRLILGVGFLGSFTTFSTLTVSVVQMGSSGEVYRGIMYLGASIILGLLAAICGIMLQKAFY